MRKSVTEEEIRIATNWATYKLRLDRNDYEDNYQTVAAKVIELIAKKPNAKHGWTQGVLNFKARDVLRNEYNKAKRHAPDLIGGYLPLTFPVNDGRRTVADVLPGKENDNEKIRDQQEEIKLLAKELTEEEAKCIWYRFWAWGDSPRPMPYRKIGKRLNKSASYCHIRVQEGIEKLQAAAADTSGEYHDELGSCQNQN